MSDVRSIRVAICALLATSSVLSAGGCRTRLWESIGPEDLALVPPDFKVTDLTVPPDFRPPPDLVLPFVCRDIWVVDSNGTFSGFNTGTRTFADVNKLDCVSPSSPQTMGVARDGFAWVLYSNADLFRVDTQTAKCQPTGFDRTRITVDNFAQMGSAFSSDQAGGADETLFVQLVTQGSLAILDTKKLTVTRVAQLTRSAELTGTGNAELWGFFPDSPSFIARIDKQTAMLSGELPVPGVGSGQVNAFAFAFWGGSFWIFIAEDGGATKVYRVDGQTGAVELAVATVGRHIIGAGVSSCAPTVEDGGIK